MTPGEALQKHVGTSYGGLVAVIIAVYMGMVIYQGNTKTLVYALQGEKGFIIWGIALIVLWIILQEMGATGAWIGGLVFLALILIVGNKLFPQITAFFASITPTKKVN